AWARPPAGCGPAGRNSPVTRPVVPDVKLSFAITFDYRCPFARVASLHVAEGLEAGAPWDVTWVPFSLAQVHVGDGEPDVWDAPEPDAGLRAQQVAVATRDLAPDRFLAVHRGLFDLRHVHGVSLRDTDAVTAVLEQAGVDPARVWDAVASGGPLDAVRKAHEAAVRDHDVWGVPTFIRGDQAAFVRLMAPPTGAEDAVRTVERILGMLDDWPELNEFKHTTIPR